MEAGEEGRKLFSQVSCGFSFKAKSFTWFTCSEPEYMASPLIFSATDVQEANDLRVAVDMLLGEDSVMHHSDSGSQRVCW